MQAHNHKYSTRRYSVDSKRHFGARYQNLQHNEWIRCIQAHSQYFAEVSASPDRPVQALWWPIMMCLLLPWKTGTESVSFIKSWFFFSPDVVFLSPFQLIFVTSVLGKNTLGNSLVVQWLGLHAITTTGPGSIHCWGTKIPQASQWGKKETKEGCREEGRKKKRK